MGEVRSPHLLTRPERGEPRCPKARTPQSTELFGENRSRTVVDSPVRVLGRMGRCPPKTLPVRSSERIGARSGRGGPARKGRGIWPRLWPDRLQGWEAASPPASLARRTGSQTLMRVFVIFELLRPIDDPIEILLRENPAIWTDEFCRCVFKEILKAAVDEMPIVPIFI